MSSRSIKSEYRFGITKKQLEEDAKLIADRIVSAKNYIKKHNGDVVFTFDAIFTLPDHNGYYGRAWTFRYNGSRPLVYDVKNGNERGRLLSFIEKYLKLEPTDGDEPKTFLSESGRINVNDVLLHLEKYFGVKFRASRCLMWERRDFTYTFTYTPEVQEDFQVD